MGEYVRIAGQTVYRDIDKFDREAEAEGKNVPNVNKRRQKLAIDYSEYEFNKLFK